MAAAALLRSIRIWLTIFIVGLVLSGITAFPLEPELSLLYRLSIRFNLPDLAPSLHDWIATVFRALHETNNRYPFLAYGTDWLAFGHLVIALAFIGPWLDPVRNKWVLAFGLLACGAVLPLALIAGPIRGIPLYWRLIDCSFGVLGAIPLAFCLRWTNRLETLSSTG